MPASAAPAPHRAAVATVTDILRQRLGPRLQTGEDVRRQHSNTMSWIPSEPPDCVAFVETTEEVREVVRICADHRVPIVPFGTGTSFEGHVNAPLGGVSVDLSRMNRVLEVNAEDLDVVVEPGVTRKQLNAHIRDTGLMFPIDPGADASIGGMVSTRASGTNAVRYGTMRENVLALKVVTASGDVMKTGGRARKSSAGYDLTRLMIGSEGTLGIITEVTLKLHGIPEEIAAGVCPFPDVRSACDATIATIQSALPIARIELVDAIQIRACNAYSKLSLPEVPHLFVEFHGTPEGVREQVERFAAIVRDCGGGTFAWATAAEERTRLWQARHDAYWAALSLRPGAAPVPTDVCLPISRLADFVAETRPTSTRPASSPPSSAMSATAISTSRSRSTWTMPTRSRAAAPSSAG